MCRHPGRPFHPRRRCHWVVGQGLPPPRGPEFLRSDNGMRTRFTAQAMQPWKNGFVESFHDKSREECLQREWFQSLEEAQVVIEKWRKHYNTQRPHSALDYTCTALARSASAGVKLRRNLPPPTKPSALSLPLRGHKN